MSRIAFGLAAILTGGMAAGTAQAGSYTPPPAPPAATPAPVPVAMRYVPPVTNPTFNETPFITTEIRPIYIHHDIPNSFASAGNNVDAIAVQARYAITDRLAFIATKDGYADLDLGALPDDDGFLNIAAGLKYALIQDPAAGRILSVGARYEAPTGNLDAGPIDVQGQGDGFANIFVTGVQQFDRFQLQGSLNGHFALDDDADSSMFVASLHANYALTDRFFPLIELNLFEYFDEPNRSGLQAEGFDVFSLGAADADTVVTAAGGFRFMVTDRFMLGAAGEVPLTDDDGEITDWRVTADAVIRF